VRLTRKQALAGAATGALGAAGVYELVDRLASSPARSAAPARAHEQHLLHGVRVVEDDGVAVLVPPLHHQLVTARVVAPRDPTKLRRAQARFEAQLAELDRTYEPSPAGLGVTVAWGRSYFDRYVPSLAEQHVPIDRRASRAKERSVSVLLDAIRFPSDPDDTILEANDVAFLLRSDDREHIADAARRLADPELFRTTSIRKGFAGGGFDGSRSLPKQMAVAAGVPGADLIPETAELFLGFTSTQRAGMGPTRIANHETLGYADLRGGYFRGGTHMHVSHVREDLEAWYVNFSFKERVDTAFRPHLEVKDGTQTVRQAPKDVANIETVLRDFDTAKTMGHSASIQTSSRLQRDHVAEDGAVYPRGTAIPHRADFNTLDNPFFFPSEASAEPQAGVHFVVFNPSSDDFNRNRLAMDGVLPDGRKLPFLPRQRGQGFNDVLRTTHRQNFLVPPRRHRAFPLAELRA